MCLTRPEVQWYTKRLYKFMRDGHRFEFTKHRGYRGMIWFDAGGEGINVVTLDHRENVISTLIHEVLHAIHDDWSETDILEMERKLINALSDRQIRNLIKRFADSI